MSKSQLASSLFFFFAAMKKNITLIEELNLYSSFVTYYQWHLEGKSYNISGSQFHHLQNGENNHNVIKIQENKNLSYFVF